MINDKFITDTDDCHSLISHLSIGVINDTNVVCGAINDECHIYTVRYTKEKQLQFTEVLNFKADFDEDACVNCTVFTKETNYLVTGGQDGVVRVYHIAHSKGKWSHKLCHELKEHTGAVMNLCLHPHNSKKWVCSGSRDGTCNLWDVSAEIIHTPKSSNLLATMNGKAIAMREAENLQTKPPASAVKNPTYECRGCEFSKNGHEIFMLICPRKGNSVVLHWLLEVTSDPSQSQLVIHPTVLNNLIISKVPCTKMKINEECTKLAVGSSDGNLILIEINGQGSGEDSTGAALKIALVKEAIHDLPITGMCFVPMEARKHMLVEGSDGKKKKLYKGVQTDMKEILLTCSADNKFIVTTLHNSSNLLMLLSLFVCVLAILTYILLHKYHDVFGSLLK